jgi:hypothetical protein
VRHAYPGRRAAIGHASTPDGNSPATDQHAYQGTDSYRHADSSDGDGHTDASAADGHAYTADGDA